MRVCINEKLKLIEVWLLKNENPFMPAIYVAYNSYMSQGYKIVQLRSGDANISSSISSLVKENLSSRERFI